MKAVFPIPARAALVALVAAAALSFAGGALAATQAGPRRVAVVVGNNVGMPSEVELRYAEDDARKIERVLVDLGGYRADDMHLVLGADAAELRSVLDEVVEGSRSEKGALLFFYYSGHADSQDLHLRGSRLSLDEIRTFLDGAAADVRVALVDACKSGALIRQKGASLGPAFDIGVAQPSGVSGTIVITSSSEDEVAQESDLLGGSFFTHFWVHGLYGAADADDDEQVTLEEAYRFAHFQTVSQTIASSGGVQHPSYELDLAGEGAIVLANLARRTALVQIESTGAGAYFILDADRRFLLTETAEVGPGTTSLRLPPGRYRIKKREERRYRVLDVELAAGEVRAVSDGEMENGALVHDGAKGSDVAIEAARTSILSLDQHGPVVRLGVRGMLFSSWTPGPHVEAGWRFAWRYVFVEPRVGVFTASSIDRPGRIHVELDVGASAGLRLPLGPVAVAAGLDGGFLLPQQASMPQVFGAEYWSEPAGLLSVAAQGRLFGEVAYTAPFDIVLLGRLHGGVGAYSAGGGVFLPPIVGGSLGVAYAF